MLARYAHLSPTYLWKAGGGSDSGWNRDQNRNQGKGHERRDAETIEKCGEPPGTRTQGPRLKAQIGRFLSETKILPTTATQFSRSTMRDIPSRF